jgi:hypothetical protein
MLGGTFEFSERTSASFSELGIDAEEPYWRNDLRFVGITGRYPGSTVRIRFEKFMPCTRVRDYPKLRLPIRFARESATASTNDLPLNGFWNRGDETGIKKLRNRSL